MQSIYILTNAAAPHWNSGKAIAMARPDWDGDWEERYFPARKKDDLTQAFNVYESVQCGQDKYLFYHWELAGPGGASFLIFAEPDTTPEEIAAAKNQIRRDRDAVSVRVFRITEWVKTQSEVAA